MGDATADFFEDLGRRGHEPLLGKTSTTFRFDVENGKQERWLVSVDKGDLAVSHKRGAPDCVIRAHRDVFDKVARGQLNAMAAALRGLLVLEGDPRLLVRFQRLFPSPPRAAGPARAGRGRAKR
jgi:putative sterol carrier protein